MDEWINDEFSLLDFGDKRVNITAKKIIKQLSSQPGASIPRAFNTASEVNCCYEFFHNGKVKAEKILAPHINATIERIKTEPIILLPQDTSSLNYTSKPSLEKDLGNISAKDNQGIFVHPLLAITPSRVVLGLVDAKIWARTQREEQLTRNEIYTLPVEEKEQFRWVESYRVACKIAGMCPNTQIITISDRECDFADYFEVVCNSQKEQHHADVIVRGSHDRAIDFSNEKAKLIDTLKNSEPLGTITFTIPAAKNRLKREVTQVVKSSKVTFKKRTANSPKITVNAVLAIEENPPEGCEPLIWFFLTTLPITTFGQSSLVIKFYLARWEIEVFFKVLKSGCKVEERRLTNGALVPLIALFLIIAWRIMYTMKLGRSCPELSVESVFSTSEWKSVYKIINKGSKLPDTPPSLSEFIIMIARLGGYLNRKNDPPPGPKAMWIGFNRMYDFAVAWEIFGSE